MSGRNYTMTDEDREAMEALLAEEAPPRANVTLDPIEIRGRPDVEGDDALDVAESAERKGPAGIPAGMSAEQFQNRVALNRIREGMHSAGREAADTAAATALTEAPAAIRGVAARLPAEVTTPMDMATYGQWRRAPEMAADWLESGTAGATGAVEGATLNLADDLGAAAAAGLTGVDFDESRESMRDVARADEAAHPLAYGLGHALGSTATSMAVPGVGPTGAGFAPALGRVASSGAVNAGLGFVEGAADYEGDDLLGEGLDEALSRAATSGAWGAGTSGVGEVVGRGLEAARRFGNQADDLRVASVIGTGNSPLSLREFRELANMPGGIPAAAERIRRLGIGSTFGTAADASERSASAVGRLEDQLAEYYAALEAANPEGVPIARLVGALEEPLADAATRPMRTRYTPRITSAAEDLVRAGEARGSASLPIREAPTAERDLGGILGDLRDRRRNLDFVARGEGDIPATVDHSVYRALRNELDRVADETVGGVDRFRGLRNDLATAHVVNDAARPAAWREARSSGPGLRATGIFAGLAERLGVVPAAVATAAADRGFRGATSFRATRAELVRDLLRTAPEELGAYAPIFARALERGGDDLLEAMVNRASEDDPELAATLAEPPPGPAAITDEAELDRLLEAPPVITDEAELDRLLNEGN